MDTHDLDYLVQCTRLRSKRRKQRMQIEAEDKLLIKKYKEQKALWKAQRDRQWVRLEPPVQRGYIRFFVLRPDVARSKDASLLLKILDKINTKQTSHRKEEETVRKESLCSLRAAPL